MSVHIVERLLLTYLTEEVNGLVRGRRAERVECAQVVGLGSALQHVPPRSVAGELHVGGRGRAQQVSDELELLDGTRGLQVEMCPKE